MVARTVDVVLRERLVDAVANELLDHGLPGATLERIAASVDTSARMLVHHFGSRHALIDAAIGRARAWELAAARTQLPAAPHFVDVLASAWAWFGSAEAARYFRLFSQVAAGARLGEDQRPAISRERLTADWLKIFADGFAAAGCGAAAAQRLATILLGQVRGLLLDRDATGEHARVERAYNDFIALLAASPDLPNTTPH